MLVIATSPHSPRWLFNRLSNLTRSVTVHKCHGLQKVLSTGSVVLRRDIAEDVLGHMQRRNDRLNGPT